MSQNYLLVLLRVSVFRSEPGVMLYSGYSPLDLWSSVTPKNSWPPAFVGSNYHLINSNFDSQMVSLYCKKIMGLGRWLSE